MSCTRFECSLSDHTRFECSFSDLTRFECSFSFRERDDSVKIVVFDTFALLVKQYSEVINQTRDTMVT